MAEYSVLMSVYAKENPEYLRESIESIWNQTVKTDDFWVVCDGPLTKELDAVLEENQKAHKEVFHLLRLKENVGLGRALNEGLKCCKNEAVARMDSDDIACKDRCEKQLRVLEEGIDIVSGTVVEFEKDILHCKAKRTLPLSKEEILKFAGRRNPFNHPCVMYRKEAVEKAGGYQHFYLFEDYYLWVRMLRKGCKGYSGYPSLHACWNRNVQTKRWLEICKINVTFPAFFMEKRPEQFFGFCGLCRRSDDDLSDSEPLKRTVL